MAGTQKERVDRELNELRVVLPGVQVLFAFLLLAGTALLGLAIATVTFLITGVVFGDANRAVAAAIAAALMVAFWFCLPLSRKAADGASTDRGSQPTGGPQP